ncbi:4Fe-4S dicluster-binding protein [Streptomyces sp. MZ04]|uniref:ATP-binding protein n=1 Tax=Streptomyces sp. MZ04 TaxID=2559236 RepID=UPI00107E9E8D|nr:4Fe-4S dicluster-binding protein [Streptomyces sp. MZ04]TGB15111.1 4Fe-4S ferredoxin [Streptomyces sp. MZ04]
MPQNEEIAAAARAARTERVTTKARKPGWQKPPRRIESSECITCDSCVRSCPPEFNAIFDRGLDVVIVPELCSGCPVCVLVCPVDCIYVDEDWSPTDSDMWTHIAAQEAGR